MSVDFVRPEILKPVPILQEILSSSSGSVSTQKKGHCVADLPTGFSLIQLAIKPKTLVDCPKPEEGIGIGTG